MGILVDSETTRAVEALVADLTDVSAHLVSERVVGRVFVGQLGLGIGVQDEDGRAEVRRR